MKILRPRFTVRRLMILVAASALALGALVETNRVWRNRAEYQARLAWHTKEARSARISSPELAGVVESLSRSIEAAESRSYHSQRRPSPDRSIQSRHYHLVEVEAQLRRSRSRQDWHESMKRKYEHAVRHPWVRVGSDTPEPE